MQKLFYLLFVCAVLFPLSARAQIQDLEKYTAEVSIDVTSANAAAAREKGMNNAYRSAFMAIAAKNTNEEGLNRLSALTDQQLVNFIKEAEVVSEKTSDIRYMATLRIKINGDLLKAYMQEQNIPVVIHSAANIIVIPTFREFPGDEPMLWESGNLWRKAWEKNTNANSNNRYISIPADGINYAALDAEKAVALNGLALDTVASHLGTSDIFVLDAVYNGIEGLKITVMPYRGGNPQTIYVSGDRSPELFTKAIPQVTAYIDSIVTQKNISMNEAPNEMTVLYTYPSLKDWIATEKKIKNLNYVNDIHVDAIGNGKIQFKISYIGSPVDLNAALRSSSLRLEARDGFYILEKI